MRRAIVLSLWIAACSSERAAKDPAAPPPAPATAPTPSPPPASARPAPRASAPADHPLRGIKLHADLDRAVADLDENRPGSTADARDASLGEALDAAFSQAADCKLGGTCLTVLTDLRCRRSPASCTAHAPDSVTPDVRAGGDAAAKLIDLLVDRDETEALPAPRARCGDDECRLAAIACFHDRRGIDDNGDGVWTCEDSRDP